MEFQLRQKDCNIVVVVMVVVVVVIIVDKTEAGLRGLCIREIDVKSQIIGHKILQ